MNKVQSSHAQPNKPLKENKNTKIQNQTNKKENWHQAIKNKNKMQTIKIEQVIQIKQSVNRVPLPVRQFQYGQVTAYSKRKSKSQFKFRSNQQTGYKRQSLKLQRMPIQIVKDKIELSKLAKSHNVLIENSQREKQLYQNEGQIDFGDPKGQNNQTLNHMSLLSSSSHKLDGFSSRQIFQMKTKKHSPKLSIFQKYNYQNYQNYNYKNPFIKTKYQQILKDEGKFKLFNFPTNNKYKLNKGSEKNLQIIFCQNKYEDFVKKTNEVMQSSQNLQKARSLQKKCRLKDDKQRQETRMSPESLINLKKGMLSNYTDDSRQLINTRNARVWSYNQNVSQAMTSQNRNNLNKGSSKSKTKIQRNNMIFHRKIGFKSSLQRNLQQFKALQKITQYHQKQQERSLKRNRIKCSLADDLSKTVLLSLIIHKYQFLKNLSKPFRNHLLKVLMGLDRIDDDIKINIHDYLKFCRIFISKDQAIQELSLFVFRLLFKNQTNPSFQAGKAILQQVYRYNRKQLCEVTDILFDILNRVGKNPQIIIQNFIQNPFWLHSFIDFIVNQ